MIPNGRTDFPVKKLIVPRWGTPLSDPRVSTGTFSSMSVHSCGVPVDRGPGRVCVSRSYGHLQDLNLVLRVENGWLMENVVEGTSRKGGRSRRLRDRVLTEGVDLGVPRGCPCLWWLQTPDWCPVSEKAFTGNYETSPSGQGGHSCPGLT